MKKTVKWIAGIILLLLLIYFAGPKPPRPVFGPPAITLPDSLPELEKQINGSEKAGR